MATIDHGKWKRYTPAMPRSDLPLSIMYAQRESDGVDWYEYVNDPASFQPDSVKIAVMYHDYAKAFVVGPAVYDATMIFPAGQIVREITDYGGTDPQADFGNKIYDPVSDSFSDMVLTPREDPVRKALAEINARLAKLEAR